MNSFELAILRILVKIQKPVSIPYLVQGFPNNSEDFVLRAITSLLNLGFISYSYGEKIDYLMYKKEKRKEILKIIDPLPELETETCELFPIPIAQIRPQQRQPIPLPYTPRGYNNRRHWLREQRSDTKIAIGTSILALGLVIMLGSTPPTSNVYRNFGLVGAHYYHHDYFPLYNVGVYYNQLTNSTLYIAQNLSTEETRTGTSILLYLPHKSLDKCNV